MSLEEQLENTAFQYLTRFLDAELTLTTKRGRFAVFRPRGCLHVQGKWLALGHPCGDPLLFRPEEILHVSGGVSVEPFNGYQLFQGIPDTL